MKKFDPNNITEENIGLALTLHKQYATQLTEIQRVEGITNSKNKFKAEVISEQQVIQGYLIDYFRAREDGSKQSVTTMTEVLQRRALRRHTLNEDGGAVVEEMISIGIKFIHEQFNDGKLFPLATFFSLIANSGVGKSDYMYLMANSFLMQDKNVLLCSYEFGEDRLARVADSEENGGKDRFREARENNKFDNLYVNYHSRDLDALELMVDIAHQNGINVILIDSFGEIERTESEYILQQKFSMMLNKKVNDYGIFIGVIAQTKANEEDGQYTVRGGTDLIYKPDISIHVKKLSAEDESGRRIVHLLKNREADVNGRTIVTEYNPITREPVYSCDYFGINEKGEPLRKLSKKMKHSGFGR